MTLLNLIRGAGLLLLAAVLLPACTSSSSEEPAEPPQVTITPELDQHQVRVQVGGELFTSYLLDSRRKELAKPVLHPIHMAEGPSITRGYPINPRPGERVDHPHHIGHWLNYGDVNGLDFWNNTGEVPEEERSEYGHIVHRSIEGTESGAGQGTLDVRMDWRGPDDKTLLQEDTRFVFRAGPDRRVIDRVTRLTASNGRVDMSDNKEGFVALRVRRELEHAPDGPVRIVGEDGTPLEEPVEHSEGVSGQYVNNDSTTGRAVWGKRSPWVMLKGVVEEDSVSVAILDHPENVGHPTYWHARGYGLFSANPLGQSVFSEGEEQLGFALESGESVTFRYRILVLTGDASVSALRSEYDQWTRSAPSFAEALE